MIHNVEVKPKSIKGAGITRDFKEAIKQFIWNGIEANATEINIEFETISEDMPGINYLKISDNGTGIDYENLQNTFGAFLDSEKQSRFTKGGKGKGRFAFIALGAKAVWFTTYKDKNDGKNYFYTISVEESKSNEFEPSSKKELDDVTGTAVEFLLLRNSFTADEISSDDFEQFLALEFGWYLEIYGEDRITIKRNGESINYKKYIEDTDSIIINIHDESDGKNYKFVVNYIKWMENIGTESRFYFLNDKHNPVERKATGFNKVGGRAYGFVHSVYVQSKYFDNFTFTKSNDEENVSFVFDKNQIDLDQKDSTYKKLMKQLHEFLNDKKIEFLKNDSEQIIDRFEKRNTLPPFGDDPISQSQKEDYCHVVKAIYKTAPTLFINLQENQEKSLLGLLSLTLKSEERENIIDIVSGIVELEPSERKELAGLLKNAKMSGVLKLLSTLQSRYKTCELLKALVYKLNKSTKERGELQSAIENNCWLFGEEYNLIGADESFNKLKKSYLDFINKESKNDEEASSRRPDVFIAKQNKISGGIVGNGTKIQNLIIELKKPSVKIGIKEYRQVEDYRNIVRKMPEFNSSLREWHMLVIGRELTDDVAVKREEFAHENRSFLVNKEGNYYIYAMTWAEVFDSFNVRHDYLLKDLDYDKSEIINFIDEQNLDKDSYRATEEILKTASN